MKIILLFAFALISIFNLNAQSQCATDEYDAFLKRTNPTYAAERQKMEQQIYSILKNKQNNPNARIGANDCQPSGVFTIPVVVHVIHKGEAIGTGTNISDAQIQNAIQGMNQQWRRITGDGVDMEIQFVLAVRDTNNNSTNGITRHDGRIFPRYVTNGIYYADTTTGANENTVINQTYWDRSKYINIWVADIRGAGGWASLFGNYTFFVHYNSGSSTYSHEMGHTFSLHHTFAGDGSGSGTGNSTQCPVNNDCLLEGDWICDTPPHKKTECSSSTCTSNGTLDNSFKNFMSYCGTRTRFTQGQKDRVRETIFNNYTSLIYSTALMPVTTPLEVGIVSIENNLDEPICNNFIPKIKIKNSGTTTITNLKIASYVDGVLNNITNINSNLLRNASDIYNLNSINFNSFGQQNLNFVIVEMNGSSSDYSSYNNQFCKEVLVRSNSLSNFCLNVEDANYNIILKQLDSINNPQLVPINGCSNVGSKSIKIDFFNRSSYYFYKRFYLPTFNLDSVYSAYLTFDRSYKQGSLASVLYLQFIIKDCDSLNTSLGYFNSNTLATVTGRDSTSPWLPTNCNHWKKDSVYLSNFSGRNNLFIDVFYVNYGFAGTQNLYLDNFCIQKRYKIISTINPTSSGNIIYSNPDGLYYEGETATIIATPDFCKSFKYWTENGVVISNNPSYTFTVNKNRNLEANFEKNRFTVAVLSNNISIGTVTGNGTYGCDTIATVIATPTSCYNFTKWTENGSTVSTNANYSFTVNNNRTLTAIFEPKSFNIALLANPTNGGTALGAGNFPCNSVLTVKAKIKTGYEFINWTEGSTIVSTDSNYTFLVSNDRNLKANFRLTTGIKQTTINEISKVYPNPANDVLLVEIRSKQNTSLTLNIIDMKGSLIESKTISNSKGTTETLFDVRKLSKGNYIINLYDEEGMASYKFVVH